MKNSLLLFAILICATAGLIGQSARDAVLLAYDVWQQAQANLERDAGAGGSPQVAQADRSAAAVAGFQATRIAYVKSAAQEAIAANKILETAATRSSPDLVPPTVAALASSELQTVTRAIAKFAADKDRGIQQLRQSLDRERIALAALNDTVQARQKTVQATSQAADALEQARIKTTADLGSQASQLSATAAEMEMEAAAWADYYDKLADAIQAANAPPPPAPASLTSAAPRNDAAPRVPLVRYVGTWNFPMANGIFHGPQPSLVELEVREQGGHINGTLNARFKPAPGSVIQGALRFTFEGDVATTPTQKFSLMTDEGTPGSIELIPGPAFNLLEVNFQTDTASNKIRNGNFILVKK